MYRRSPHIGVHVRRPDADKVVAVQRARAPRTDTALRRRNALLAGPLHAGAALQKHYATGHHEFNIKLS